MLQGRLTELDRSSAALVMRNQGSQIQRELSPLIYTNSMSCSLAKRDTPSAGIRADEGANIRCDALFAWL